MDTRGYAPKWYGDIPQASIQHHGHTNPGEDLINQQAPCGPRGVGVIIP